MGRLVIIIALALSLSGCATSLEIDRRGIRHTATPPDDAGLTWRTIAIEAGKIVAAGAGAYIGSRQ